MGKIKYCSRANQWCNRRVDTFLHSNFIALQRSKGMSKKQFFGIWASLAAISGLLGMEIDDKIHGIINLELKI